MGREQHTRRAYPALRRSVIDQCLLQCRQLLAVSKTFNRQDLAVFHLTHRDEATIHDLTVDQDRAGTTLTFAASFLRAGEAELLPQHVEQPARAKDVERDRRAVQRKAHAANTFSGVAGISSSHTPVAS